MRKFVWLCLAAAVVLVLAGDAGAAKREKAKLIADPWLFSSKSAVDTIFFDDFETDTMGWDTMDIAVQEPYWNINTYCPIGAYAGHHWWCGTNKFAGIWANSPGYGNGWVQMLYSPDFDLTSISSDSVQLRFYHYYNVEPPGGGHDWDCVNLWASTDGGGNWTLLRPDTMRSEGGELSDYNLYDSYAWHYTGLVPDSVPIAGWGGTNGGWRMVTFDLTQFKGQTVKLRFAVVSDPLESDENAGPYHGAWYFDNLSVDTLSAGGGRGHIFFDDCEEGNIGWTPGSKTPAIHWHKTTYRSNSPVRSWYCGDETTRQHSWGYSDAIVSPFIDLRQVQTTQPCRVDFKFWAHMPDTGNDANGIFDNYSVDISADSGYSWQGVTPYVYVVGASESQQWLSHQQAMGYLNISSYVGKVVKIRIAVSTDGDMNVGEGLYIDDFLVTGKTREPLPPPSTVLVVDNDGDAVDLSDESWSKYLEYSLANLGYRFSSIIIGTHKELIPGYLEQYPVVIWNLGCNYDGRLPGYKAITSRNYDFLMNYLNSGGKLWIIGQTYLGFSNPDTTIHPNLWTDYLHLSPENGWWNSPTYNVAGVAGDLIGDGFYEYLDYDRLNGGFIGWTFPWRAYSLTPDTPSYPVVGFMMADDGSYNGLRFWDSTGTGYKIVHTSFPFEALNSWQSRDTLVARIMRWFLEDTLDYMPPQPPSGLTVLQDSNKIVCWWRANAEPDLAGYRVYRAIESGLPVWTRVGEVSAPDTVFKDSLIVANNVYVYAVTAFDQRKPANESRFSRWSFIRAMPWEKAGNLGWPEDKGVPFQLHQNLPNPARGSTNIRFSLPEACRVELTVYNILGQSVATLAQGIMGPGTHDIVWNLQDRSGRALSSGCYFYRMEAVSHDGARRYGQTRNMIILP